MLMRWSRRGSATETRTSIWAAWWFRTENPPEASRSRASGSFTPQCTNSAASGTFSRRPLDRSSNTVTANPLARYTSATWDPMNPAPPVTNTLSVMRPPSSQLASRARTVRTEREK